MMILLAALAAALIGAAYFGRRAFHQPVGDPDGSARARHDWAKSNMLGSAMVWALFAALVLIAALCFGAPPAHAAHARPGIAYRVCGPEGTVDMDPQGASDRPVPHCNRAGWNGHRYAGAETARTPTFDDAIAICRLAEAGSAEAKARYAAIADAARPAVMLVCLGYHQAVLDARAPAMTGGAPI